MKYTFLTSIILFGLLLQSCNDSKPKTDSANNIEENSIYFNAILDSLYDYELALSPTSLTYEGSKVDNDKWGVSNDSVSQFYNEVNQKHLNLIQDNFDPQTLDKQSALTYTMFVDDYQESLDNFKWRFHNYPINQMFGTHTWIPSFLMNIHTIDSKEDADAYLARLSEVDTKIDELIVNLETRKEKGIVAPKFVYPYVVQSAEFLIKGYPFEEEENDNPILADFKRDAQALVDSAVITEEESKNLISQVEIALLEIFKPAYQKLIDYVPTLEAIATEDAGVWKLPDGGAYYQMALKRTTTTEYTPQEIFDIGMSEVERIHSEMEKIMEQVGFEGDLNEFFTFMQTDEQFYFPQTEEGQQGYLDANIALIDTMREHLDQLFITKPKAKLEVKRVEPYREQSAGIAFYESPAIDGSRPGVYYANLFDMSMMPKYEMEALSYHEAIPGHHMQLSIAQELENLPKFRTRGAHYTAYVEGWGLYSEYIPKEYGFYEDPYSDFGRLSMELWRACRLVVDVGIHNKKWTREEGIAFYDENTPAPMGDCIKMVERHIVMASQATAYKIGQLKILELRNKAKDALGEKFDIREFHEVVLTNGAVPLNVLEDLVDEYIAKNQFDTI